MDGWICYGWTCGWICVELYGWNVIYMWYMWYCMDLCWIYVILHGWNVKKTEKKIYPDLPSANTRQSWGSFSQHNSFAECWHGTRQSDHKFAECQHSAKIVSKKNYFAKCLSERHSANIIFLKKIKNSLPSACHVSTRQRNRQMTVDVNFAECWHDTW